MFRKLIALAIFGCACSEAAVDGGARDAAFADPDAAVADAIATPVDAEAVDSGVPDTGEPDAGAPDAESIPDSGVATCPLAPNPACARAADCNPDSPPPTNCMACTAYNDAVCASATCAMPAQLESNDVHLVHVTVPSSIPTVMSFAGTVLDTTTSGGRVLSCADVYADSISWAGEPCINVLDVRLFSAIAQPGSTYAFAFSRFASGRRVLFVVYGYSSERAQGTRQGVSCTEFPVGAPGTGSIDVAGEEMRLIP